MAKLEKKKHGFTLSEVLITLAIIGILATLTIPAIISKYQKHYLPVQLKIVYSDITNALNKYMVDNGYNGINDSPLGDSSLTVNQKRDIFIDDILSKYIKGSKVDITSNYKYLGSDAGNQNVTWNFRSEKGYYIRINSSFWDSNLSIYIDVNGAKAPNRFGFDAFRFYIYDKAIPTSAYKNMSDWNCTYNCGDCCRPDTNPKATGFGCWARIMQEGWKINY